MTSIFQELATYMGEDHDPQTWDEHSVEWAIELMKKFGAQDWDKLTESWPDLPLTQQQRWAGLLSDAAGGIAIPILLEMIRVGPPNLLMAACNSLRCHLQGRGMPLKVSPQILDRIRSLAESPVVGASPLRSWSLQTLLESIE